MKNYWSCTQFADWVRGTSKLKSGTREEWHNWEKLAEQKLFRYWLAEEGLDLLQEIIFWPTNRLKALVRYVNKRWVTKSHALTSNLKRGQWHEFDTRLLHAAFDELINFVEIEQAWMEANSSCENSKKYRTSWYCRWFRMRLWRSPEAGIAHLQWAAELKMAEDWIDKENPDYGKPTHQALAAQETLLLYIWWKEERPNRIDPYDASGWTQYCQNKREKTGGKLSDFLANNDDAKASHILEHCRKLQADQDEEDTTMLIRLIKLRHSLWT